MRLPVQPLRGTEAALAANVSTLERDEVAVATDTGRIYLVVPGSGGVGNALQQLAPAGSDAPSYGNTFLKENTIATVINPVASRRIPLGATQFKALSNNFAHDPVTGVLNGVAIAGTNGLLYTGTSPILTRTVCSISVSVTGNNRKIGLYLCVNRNGTPLDEADRFTETEVYQFASAGRNEAATIQMLETLNQGDRVYLRVQNDSTTDSIVVNFFNLVTISV